MFQMKWIGAYYPMEYIPSENIYKTSTTKRKPQYFLNYSNTWNINSTLSIETGVKNIFNQINTTLGPFLGRTYYINLKYQIK